MSGIFSGFGFAFVSLENKYFGRWLVGRNLLGFCVLLVGTGGTSPLISGLVE
jgi:hypothetical protein